MKKESSSENTMQEKQRAQEPPATPGTNPPNCNKCGFALTSNMLFCGGCGVSLQFGSQEKPGVEAQSKHASSANLFANALGEHKHATVMFADLRNSLNFIQGSDPEWVEKFIDIPINVMIDVVHEYHGSVLQVQGDGILAIFGAPVAYEDHALRACHAALQIFRQFESLKAKKILADDLHAGIGINSGKVVISSINTSLGSEIRAVGTTTWLASRLETLAAAGVAIMSESTYSQVQGFVEVESLGNTAIKGESQALALYELRGLTSLTRFQALVTHGLTPLVGRTTLLDELETKALTTQAGKTITITLKGDPGVGKSRIAFELVERLKSQFKVIEISGFAFSQAPLGVFSRLLRNQLKISPRDNHAIISEKLAICINKNEFLKNYHTAFATLLDLPVQDKEWSRLNPVQRQKAQFSGLLLFLAHIDLPKPLLLLAEDLHWFDKLTVDLLEKLTEGSLSRGLLLLTTTRPEPDNAWKELETGKMIHLNKMNESDAANMVLSLIGNNEQSRKLSRFLTQHAECNPFYIEETIRSLVDEKILTGRRGNYVLSKDFEKINIPTRIEAIISSRFDRLAEDLKQVLRVAAVLNDEIDPLVIAQVLHIENDVKQKLDKLVALNILFEPRTSSSSGYQFRHALIPEVIFGSLYSRKKKQIHLSILETLEQIYQNRINEKAEQLAHHAEAGELWSKAVRYYKLVVSKAIKQSANEHASAALEKALACLKLIYPVGKEQINEGIELRLQSMRALLPLGNHKRIRELLNDALKTAQLVGDQKALGTIYSQLAISMWIFSEHQNALDYAEKAIEIAGQTGSLPLSLAAQHSVGMVLYSQGKFEDAISLYKKVITEIETHELNSRIGWVGYPSVICRTFLGASLTLVGRYEEALEVFEEGCLQADTFDDPYSRAIVNEEYALCLMRTGQMQKAQKALELATEVCKVNRVENVYPSVCARLIEFHTVTGEFETAISLAENALESGSAYIGGSFVNSLLMTAYAHALECASQLDKAMEIVNSIIQHAKDSGERPNLANAYLIQAEIFLKTQGENSKKCQTAFAHAHKIAKICNMPYLQTRSLNGLNKVKDAIDLNRIKA